MEYREKGEKFCNEINAILSKNNLKCALVIGGGYAYNSTKYNDSRNKADYDFMIVYDKNEYEKIIPLLQESLFTFEEKYLELDKKLLKNRQIDIIRLSGYYLGNKATINLVPKDIVEKICDFQADLIFKKIAHNRNTSLFFAYGSDNSRIIVNFISPSFVTENGEDHYVHLDFSHIEKNNNIYLGILADAILKGFANNYDTINFKELRKKFIKNIHSYFEKNKIDSKCFINIFANNAYFPNELKVKLLQEFNFYGEIEGNYLKPKRIEPIVFTAYFKSNFECNAFNFINNKSFKCNFKTYIEQMQSNEYDRQYLLDALGKFLGYLYSSNKLGNENWNGTIIDNIQVYGVNDLYLPNYSKYTIDSIVKSFVKDLLVNKSQYNNELIINYLLICLKFLAVIEKKDINSLYKEYNVKNGLFNMKLNSEMEIDVLKKLNNFIEVGTYHNYTSKAMKKYTVNEADFLCSLFKNKGANILDIMCGYGRIANELARRGYTHVVGIDLEKYEFLGVPKDFIYINDDFFDYNFNECYQYAYSLYNSFISIETIEQIIQNTGKILNKNGLLILDYFNKKWRDNIPPAFYKELYRDEKYLFTIRRNYNCDTGNEITIYELFENNILIRQNIFEQKFFESDDINKLIDDNNWNLEENNSNTLNTRTNAQKNILILRKK